MGGRVDRKGRGLLLLMLLSFSAGAQETGSRGGGGLAGVGRAGMQCYGDAAWMGLGDPCSLDQPGSYYSLLIGQPYGVEGLTSIAAGFSACSRHFALGTAAFHSGDRLQSLSRLGLGASLDLGTTLRAGCQLRLLRIVLPCRGRPLLGPEASLSLRYQAYERLGLQTNVSYGAGIAEAYHQESWWLIGLGGRYELAKEFAIVAELSRDASGPSRFRAGIDARVGKKAQLYLSADAGTRTLCLGWVMRIGRYGLGVAAEHHPLLGSSPWAGATYYPKSHE